MSYSIMIQGTMSSVGKSFLSTALCRIFRQDGYSTAPFKSQNMALNSFITPDGCEIGRAQALQAQASGIEPSPLMNPILLKPSSDMGSQVIVNGKVYGNMSAREYFRCKRDFIPCIMDSFNKLSEQYDIIVIEGAGSPVELNLKKDDIVNMGLAELVKSPVLLAGDIDRGGIFAQMIGTLSLLEPHERNMVKGLAVNRFRGDISLFSDGVSILEEKSGKPVVGVVPCIDCNIEDEDSLSEKILPSDCNGTVDIAVIKLTRMSNFTDFDVFRQYSGVSLRFVSVPSSLGTPDLIIIPGTKSTIADMKWLRKSGMESAVKELVSKGTAVFGICGGYQILGTEISDPYGSESFGSTEGMGLLDCKTVFGTQKKQCRVTGKFCETDGFFSCLSGAEFYGYEVHMGTTKGSTLPLTSCGGSFSKNVAGCYVHGIFDSAEVSGRLVKKLFSLKGIEYSGTFSDRNEYREEQIDMIADIVRKSMDMELVYRIIEEYAQFS